MHVTIRDIPETVALIEHPHTIGGERRVLRVLVFREGVVSPCVVRVLGKLLAHV